MFDAFSVHAFQYNFDTNSMTLGPTGQKKRQFQQLRLANTKGTSATLPNQVHTWEGATVQPQSFERTKQVIKYGRYCTNKSPFR